VSAARLAGLGTTIFASTTARADALGAVNLGQGMPEGAPPARMMEVASEAMAAGLNQYTGLGGLPELRTAVCEDLQSRLRLTYDPDTEVLVTYGATEAVSAAVLALCDPGDELLVLDPAYDSYAAAAAFAGARAVPVPLDLTGGGPVLDPEVLEAAVTDRTRALLLNSPHNPSGRALSEQDLAAVADVCVRHDLTAVTDEVYEHLLHRGRRHASLAAAPGMRERTLRVSSAGKTFTATGWKVGWVTGPAPLVTAVRTVKQFLTFTGNGPFQAAVAHGLRCEQDWVRGNAAALERRRDLLATGLQSVGLEVLPDDGGYFLLADTGSVGEPDAAAYAERLMVDKGVAAIPASAFTLVPGRMRSLLRFAYCRGDDTVAEAVRRLQA
jgi:N-succinyldiaminopimelate aminotransferase